MKYFLDTNIFLRGILHDHVPQSIACQKLLQKLDEGKLSAVTTDLVIAEIVYVLKGQLKSATKTHIWSILKPILAIPNLYTPSKSLWAEIFDVYVNKNIDFIDAYNAVIMQSQGLSVIYSYDRDFEKIASLKRREP